MFFTAARHYIRNFLGQSRQRCLVMMNKNRAQAEVVLMQTSAPCACSLPSNAECSVWAVSMWLQWFVCVYALTAYVEALKHMFSRPSMPVIKMFKHRKWTALAVFFFPLTWGSTWKHHLLCVYISDGKIYTGSTSTLLALKRHIFNAVDISDQCVPLHSRLTLASYGKYLKLTGTKTVTTA